MKYGTSNTYRNSPSKLHGHTKKPATLKYFTNLQWLKNAKRKALKQKRIEAK